MTPNDSAFPYPDEEYQQFGLTKREYFAALAMQGILASRKEDFDDLAFPRCKKYIAEVAASLADALIKALEATK